MSLTETDTRKFCAAVFDNIGKVCKKADPKCYEETIVQIENQLSVLRLLAMGKKKSFKKNSKKRKARDLDHGGETEADNGVSK